MISIISNLLDAITGFLQPLMSLNMAIYDFAALLQRWLPGVMALWGQVTRLLGMFGQIFPWLT